MDKKKNGYHLSFDGINKGDSWPSISAWRDANKEKISDLPVITPTKKADVNTRKNLVVHGDNIDALVSFRLGLGGEAQKFDIVMIDPPLQ